MTAAMLLQQWYDDVWNKDDADSIAKLMHKDIIIHGLDPAGSSKGVEHFQTFYANFKKSFPFTQITVEHLVSNDEIATAYCHVHAKSSSGKDVNFSGLSVARFSNGKLIEAWNNFDFLKMYQQLGHILVSEISETGVN